MRTSREKSKPNIYNSRYAHNANTKKRKHKTTQLLLLLPPAVAAAAVCKSITQIYHNKIRYCIVCTTTNHIFHIMFHPRYVPFRIVLYHKIIKFQTNPRITNSKRRTKQVQPATQRLVVRDGMREEQKQVGGRRQEFFLGLGFGLRCLNMMSVCRKIGSQLLALVISLLFFLSFFLSFFWIVVYVQYDTYCTSTYSMK